MSESTGSAAPYGPATSAIRTFLVRLAGLSASDRERVVGRFRSSINSPAWRVAERVLSDTMERSGRTRELDALAGPLWQLVTRPQLPYETLDVLERLEPIADPALAALLALLVRDLLSADHVATLYAPFADEIPLFN